MTTNLSSIANRVELHVVRLHVLRPVLLHHGLLQELSNRSGFLLVHGRLIRQSNLVQHGIRIKTLGHGLAKVLHKGLLVSTIDNVVRYHFGFLHIFDTNVVFAKGCGRDRFLVSVLAVNDGGVARFLVLVDRVPHFGDPGAGGIDHFNVLLVQVGHFFKGGAKGGQNHHVAFADRFKILGVGICHGGVLFNELHLHVFQIFVHFGIVNEFVGDVHFAIGKVLHRFVRQRDGTFDAPAESKIL